MNKLREAINNYMKAGEELANCAAIVAIEKKFNLSVGQTRELMDRICFAEILGARAERSILEAITLKTAMEVLAQKMAEQIKSEEK